VAAVVASVFMAKELTVLVELVEMVEMVIQV
jgi:hypothetical protein